jgi:hypothetical protein
MNRISRVAVTALVSGGLGLAALGVGAGTANAYTYGPFQWCPGQALPNDPPRPEGSLVWDMSVWEGENLFPTPIPPPPPQPLPPDCPPWSPFLAPSRCGGL